MKKKVMIEKLLMDKKKKQSKVFYLDNSANKIPSNQSTSSH